jgi:hypothetical protein
MNIQGDSIIMRGVDILLTSLTNSYEMLYDRTSKRCPFNAGDCLIEVMLGSGLNPQYFIYL